MEFNFKLTETDYATFNVFHYKGSASVKRQILILRLLAPLLLIFICWVSKWDSTKYIFAGIISVIFIITLDKILYRSIRRQAIDMFRESNGSCCDYIIEYTDEYIRSTNAARTMESKWSGIQKIEEDAEHLYIYISSMQAFIIPYSAFEADEDKSKFKDYVYRAIGKAN